MALAKYREDIQEEFIEHNKDKDFSFYAPSISNKTPFLNEIKLPKYACPFCIERYETYCNLSSHLEEKHNRSKAVFLVNGEIIKEDLTVKKLKSIQARIYGIKPVQCHIISMDEDSEIASTTLDSHNIEVDFSKLLQRQIIKRIKLLLETENQEEEYIVTQKLNIHDAKIKKDLYKSKFFIEEVTSEIYKLAEYRIFLSLLINEKDKDGIEMLMEKISDQLVDLSSNNEELIDFCLFYSLSQNKNIKDIAYNNLNNKDYYAYCQLIAILNYNLDEAVEYESKIGKKDSDFQIGCALLLAILQNDSASIKYFEEQYKGIGILNNLISCLIFIYSASPASSIYSSSYNEIKDFQNIPLIQDIMNIISTYKATTLLSDSAYTHFNLISPFVCFLKIQQTENDEIRNKIAKSGIKRFNNCEWFYKNASLYLNNEWLESRITKRMPELYWDMVNKLNQKKEIPYTTSFINKIKNSNNICIKAIGNPFSVGCSCFVLSVDGYNIMLDCGIRPDKTDETAYPDFSKCNSDIDIIIISHAHIDHSGAIMRAHSLWPNATILMTRETKAYLEPMFHSMIVEDESLKDLEDILFDKEIVLDTYNSIIAVDFENWISLSKYIKVKFHKAGHLLGAAVSEININNQTILYTGDFCLHNQELTEGCKLQFLPKNVDLLISEATYLHKNITESWCEQREKLINDIAKENLKGKTILLPATAIGRSQELLCIVADMIRNKILPQNTKIYVAGLAFKACVGIEKILNENYSEIIDALLPLENGAIPEKGSIIIASSGTMSKKSASYKIANLIKNRNPNELVIISGNGIDEDSWMLTRRNIKDKLYPLSVHAFPEDIQNLIKATNPSNVAFVHCGINDNKELNKIITEYEKEYEGNKQFFVLFDNSEYNITDLKENIEKEFLNE